MVEQALGLPLGEVSRLVVLSPHLDDAVLSCAALLEVLAPLRTSVIVSVFTEATPPPWSRPARSFLRTCGHSDAQQLYAARRAEDAAVVHDLGALPQHWGLVDALFRRSSRGFLRPRALYPTYRYDIARSRVARQDRALADNLAPRVAALCDEPGVLLLAPVGVARHVDHRIVRDAAVHAGRLLGSGVNLVHYSDYPYSATAGPDPAFTSRHGLVPFPVLPGRRAATRWFPRYATQWPGLVLDGRPPLSPEIYWRPA